VSLTSVPLQCPHRARSPGGPTPVHVPGRGRGACVWLHGPRETLLRAPRERSRGVDSERTYPRQGEASGSCWPGARASDAGGEAHPAARRVENRVVGPLPRAAPSARQRDSRLLGEAWHKGGCVEGQQFSACVSMCVDPKGQIEKGREGGARDHEDVAEDPEWTHSRGQVQAHEAREARLLPLVPHLRPRLPQLPSILLSSKDSLM
jgi:hypothetical protein